MTHPAEPTLLDYIRTSSTPEHAPIVRDVPSTTGGKPLSEGSCNCGWTQGPPEPAAIANGTTRLVALQACINHLNEAHKPVPVSMTSLQALDYAIALLSSSKSQARNPRMRDGAIASLTALRETIASKQD